MSIETITRRRIFGLLASVSTMLAGGLLLMRQAGAEEVDDEAALKKRFEFLSQNTNVDCSVQFEASIATMAPDARLQGSCCAPMDEARYRQQLNGLRNYSEIAEVPPDPYDISAPLAHKLIGYYDLALSKEEQAAYDYAMAHSDMEGPCCCQCWRWKVYGGLGKYLIRTRHYTGQQVVDLWNVGQGCGGPTDTKMH
jgi:hypothetical protein